MVTLDIGGRFPYPAGTLSNFTAHVFVFRGVPCASPEGLLQAFKFDDKVEQERICGLVGCDAKRAGTVRNDVWRAQQKLWWEGVPYARQGPEYQGLLDELYDTLAQNEQFQRALLDTGDAMLVHSIGCSDPAQTVLTESEFCTRLMRVRDRLRAQLAL